MKNENYINDRVINLSNDILNYLYSNQSQTITTWEIKMHFKIPSSMLYLALGMLLSNKKINLIAENLIYKIELIRENEITSDVKNP